MKVLKFGGTSVGSAQRMKEVAKLITDGEQKIVVLSAMSGKQQTHWWKFRTICIRRIRRVPTRLLINWKQNINSILMSFLQPRNINRKVLKLSNPTSTTSAPILKTFSLCSKRKWFWHRESLSLTAMVNFYLQECGVKSVLLPALEFMRTDKNAEPDPVYIKEKLRAQLDLYPDTEIYITQGFICRNAYGEIDNLQRGGSDYTASLIGAAVNASEIQIWTDIDGMHNNDPRIVDKTAPVRQLHFEEAAELAYFGAKILHPTCIQPAKYANIPVRLLNTMDPEAPGTLISNDTEKGKIKAVAAKE